MFLTIGQFNKQLKEKQIKSQNYRVSICFPNYHNEKIELKLGLPLFTFFSTWI